MVRAALTAANLKLSGTYIEDEVLEALANQITKSQGPPPNDGWTKDLIEHRNKVKEYFKN